MNLTIYGDSILKGVLLENGRYTVNRQWDAALNQQLGGTVKNRSRFGCTIQKAMAVITRDCQTPQPGDYALLEFGGNDCDYRWAEVADHPDQAHDCNTPPESFVKTYRQAIALIRQSGRTPVMATLPPIHSERYLGFICRDGLSRDRILHWLGDVDAIYRWQESYSRLVEDIARQEDVKLLDVRAAFLRDERTPEELLCLDGIHPSRGGQKLIFDSLCAGVA
jgi:lysophospholipase L1-like esterase